MHKTLLITLATIATLGAQNMERRASMGHGPEGRVGCTVTVVVDGVAEVEIRGDHAVIRDISGQAPQFREFECSGPMPPNPAGFNFTAEAGRGRQELVRQPREGGPAVVRISDPESGEGEYRFRLTWGGDQGDRREPATNERREPAVNDRGRDGGRDRDANYPQDRERFFQGEGWRRNLFQRVREDLEHVSQSTIPFTGDRRRVERTIAELNDLQSKLSQGRYDERSLENVMGSLRAMVEENRMPGRDREAISDDLNRLRDFRDHHDDYGARYPRN